jgi:hypothetical protein
MFDAEVFDDTDIGALVDDDEFKSFWDDIQLEDIASAPTQRNDPDLGNLTLLEFFNQFNVDFENQLEEEDDSVVDLVSDVLQDDRQQKNRKRRLNEVERLEKYSWERVKRCQDSEAEKRVRYDYINRNSGARVSSLRLAMRQCRAADAKSI